MEHDGPPLQDVLRVGNNEGPTGGSHAHEHAHPSSQTTGTHFASSGKDNYASVSSGAGDSGIGSSHVHDSNRTRPAVSPADTFDSENNSAAGSGSGLGSASGSNDTDKRAHAATDSGWSNVNKVVSTADSSNTSLDKTKRHRPPALPPYSRFRGAVPSYTGGGRSILIILLRNDLRVLDNRLFVNAHRNRAFPPAGWTKERANHNQNGSMRSNQSQRGDGLPNHSLQGMNGGNVFAEEWSMSTQADYVLPLFVFDERIIELSGLPDYQREGPEARTPEYGFWKTGGFRVRFIVECIADLRQNLIARGSDLLLRFGKTENVLDELIGHLTAQGDSVEAVWMQKEATSEDNKLERDITSAARSHSVPVHFSYSKTLVHPCDLPFDIKETPDIFTPFRKRIESLGKRMVRCSADPPQRFKRFPHGINDEKNYQLNIDAHSDVNGVAKEGRSKINPTPPEHHGVEMDTDETRSSHLTKQKLFSWDDLMRALLHPIVQPQVANALNDYTKLTVRHSASAFPFRGGETSAQERLAWYIVHGRLRDDSGQETVPVAQYKQTRNNLLGPSYSTKFSPFLAYGCISPRQIWEALDRIEAEIGQDQSTYWVRFELLWRDYFFLVAAKFGDCLFELGGFEMITDPRQAEKKLKPGWWKTYDPQSDGPNDAITRLLEARTGIPFIDANITELRESGYMSNRGRQNVASFLAKDLGCDWRVGAELFASQLIDYDPSSNYGNWQYVAGVGNDPRAFRQFNTIKQAKDYDSFGEYVKTWIPVLRNLPTDYVHTPWLLSGEQRWQYGVKSSEDQVTKEMYPAKPMIELDSWTKHYERRDGSGSKMRGGRQEKVKDLTARFRRLKKSNARDSDHVHKSDHDWAKGRHSLRPFSTDSLNPAAPELYERPNNSDTGARLQIDAPRFPPQRTGTFKDNGHASGLPAGRKFAPDDNSPGTSDSRGGLGGESGASAENVNARGSSHYTSSHLATSTIPRFDDNAEPSYASAAQSWPWFGVAPSFSKTPQQDDRASVSQAASCAPRKTSVQGHMAPSSGGAPGEYAHGIYVSQFASDSVPSGPPAFPHNHQASPDAYDVRGNQSAERYGFAPDRESVSRLLSFRPQSQSAIPSRWAYNYAPRFQNEGGHGERNEQHVRMPAGAVGSIPPHSSTPTRQFSPAVGTPTNATRSSPYLGVGRSDHPPSGGLSTMRGPRNRSYNEADTPAANWHSKASASLQNHGQSGSVAAKANGPETMSRVSISRDGRMLRSSSTSSRSSSPYQPTRANPPDDHDPRTDGKHPSSRSRSPSYYLDGRNDSRGLP